MRQKKKRVLFDSNQMEPEGLRGRKKTLNIFYHCLMYHLETFPIQRLNSMIIGQVCFNWCEICYQLLSLLTKYLGRSLFVIWHR